ncbi:YceD family protein [Amphibiibacter pelophylacis]|uniref:YceD family protein n=1 Tax=Amphibiibacter pelophylacis TaxID=1799477 RepID=A0ACC6P4A2_9BURK
MTMNRPSSPPESASESATGPVPEASATQRLDISVLCRQGQPLAGELPLAQLRRLCTYRGVWPEQAAQTVTWRLVPSVRQAPGDADQLWVDMTLHTRIALQCQRCLERTDAVLDVSKAFRFVHTEAELDRVEAVFDEIDSDDEALLLEPGWPLLDWLEDELILALPIAPRHDDCQIAGHTPSDDPLAGLKPNPFAVLEKLKKS